MTSRPATPLNTREWQLVKRAHGMTVQQIAADIGVPVLFVWELVDRVRAKGWTLSVKGPA